MEINNAAPVITRDEITIKAPLTTIWFIQTDIDRWSSWQPDVSAAHLVSSTFSVGSEFRWQTAGLDITSMVQEVEPLRRIVWGGPAQGIVAIHVWTFAQQADGVLVRTAESWEGEPVDAQTEILQQALDGSLRQWLENLKRTAEAHVTPSET